MSNEQPPCHPVLRGGGGILQRFTKAYGKARAWHCSRPQALLVGVRFAVWGDSGRFTSHGGWRVSRISRGDHDT